AVRGATIMFVPAAFRFETGVDHWEPLLRARAIEDQAFVVDAAQWGTWGPPGRERRNYGHSLVADPWGNLVAQAPDEVGVTFAELDLARVEAGRGHPAPRRGEPGGPAPRRSRGHLRGAGSRSGRAGPADPAVPAAPEAATFLLNP